MMNPIPTWLRKLWNVWDVRMLVLLSLSFQIILFIFGKQRKYTAASWIGILVWFTYLTADWVATVSLGKLSDAQANSDNISDPNNALRAIWALLLLLHLGGPDTITAYSVEDNKLWLRHLLGLVVQVAVVIYAILMSLSASLFSFLMLPVLVAGIIKYGERTWALMSANGGQSPNIIRFDDVPSKTEYHDHCPGTEVLGLAQHLLSLFKPHFENYVLPDSSEGNIQMWLLRYRMWSQDALEFWKVFEVEMGLMYDLIYTKAVITYTKAGCILRGISFSCTVSALVGFFLIVFMKAKSNKHDYSTIEIAVTGVLLVGALVLEIYGVTLAISSDWTMLCLIKHRKVQLVSKLFQKFPMWFSSTNRKRWSNSMGQFNLVAFCLKREPKMWISRFILQLFGFEEVFDRYIHKTHVNVPEHLKANIIRFISRNIEEPFTTSGERTIRGHGGLVDMEGFFVSDFGERIFILYIATVICYHDDHELMQVSGAASTDNQRDTSKLLSEHMVYLLFICPSLLPIRWDIIIPERKNFMIERYFARLKQLSSEDLATANEREACRILGNLSAAIRGSNDYHGRVLLMGVNEVVQFLNRNIEARWEILGCLWIEMLCYAAKECQQLEHIQLLRQGGELLTLVWLLLTQSYPSNKSTQWTVSGKRPTTMTYRKGGQILRNVEGFALQNFMG